MAREWTRAGHEVHVLTGDGHRGGEPSPDLVATALETKAIVHRTEAVAISPDHAKENQAVIKLTRLGQILAQWKQFPDQQRSWIPAAKSLAARLQAENRFDIVWSTSPPESCHLVAASLAAGGVPWVADFRDPWADYFLARWDPLSRLAIGAISRRVLRRARVITAATFGIAQSIGRGAGRQVHCVRNGFDRCLPIRPAVVETGRRDLGYFGRVDPRDQHPERLWPALRMLRERGRPCGVRFHLTQGSSGQAGFSVPPDLQDLVSFCDPLAHSDVLEAMASHLGLLVLCLESRRSEGIVPAKLYEYVGSGRPTLVVAPAYYEARRLCEELHLGLGAWTPDEIVNAIERLEGYSVPPTARAKLARSATAAEMMAFLEAAVERPAD
jgi:hypothetical protein